jgi:hypothetical protein
MLLFSALCRNTFKLDRVTYDSMGHFTATDILVLVPEAHMGKTSR